jgi:predicted site-specific integrase-resolvase
MTNAPRATRTTDTPSDLIPAYRAAEIARCSAYTLARWADRGRVRAWRRPGFKVRFYSEAEVRGMLPQPVAPRRSR